MVNETVKKHFLEQALYELRMANDHLKRANGADLLNTGLVLDCVNYKKMIEHLIEGVVVMLNDTPDAEHRNLTWRELTEGCIQKNSTNIEALRKRLTALEWSVAEG